MKKLIILVLPLITIGCASGPCPRGSEQAVTPSSSSSSPPPTTASDSAKVVVFKADGSKQCGQGKPIALTVMEAQLKKAGIKVYSSAKKPDGMMHTQVCGAATGMANTYEIDIADLPKATKLGFSRLEN